MKYPAYDVSIMIEAPAEEVYDYIADFPRHVEWNTQPVKMEPQTNGPTQVGSVYRTQEQMPRDMPRSQKLMFTVMQPMMKLMWGASGYTEATITEMERPQRLAWQARLPSRKGDLMRMNWSMDLRSEGSGTHLVQHCEICPPEDSPMLRMFDENRMAALANDAKKEVYANLEELKRILESN